jgi:non-specific serine/threonine protein kinase
MRFEIRGNQLSLIAGICRRLDGIPLALEFAAARVADMGLVELARQLDDLFSILNRGRRTALPRHRTLSAALDWSYSLLSENEQRLLWYLASSESSFTSTNALTKDYLGGFQNAPEALSGLFEKCLLNVEVRENVPVYRMLNTTRAYVSSLKAS